MTLRPRRLVALALVVACVASASVTRPARATVAAPAAVIVNDRIYDRLICNVVLRDNEPATSGMELQAGQGAARCFIEGHKSLPYLENGDLIDVLDDPVWGLDMELGSNGSQADAATTFMDTDTPGVTAYREAAPGALEFRFLFDTNGINPDAPPVHTLSTTADYRGMTLQFGHAGGAGLVNSLRCGATGIGTITNLSGNCAQSPRVQLTLEQGAGAPVFPTWPADNFTNNDPRPTTDNVIPPPQLSCGRTIEYLGAGTYWAHMAAAVVNPRPGASDSEGYWTVSWSSQTYPGANAVIPVPAGAGSPTDRIATYHMQRDTANGGSWVREIDDGGTWIPTHDSVLSYMVDAATWYPLAGDRFIWGADFFLPGGSGSPSTNGFGPSGYLLFEQGAQLVPGEGFDTVQAGCSIRVDPVLEVDDPPVVIIIVPPHPSDPGPGPGGDPPPVGPPGEEDGEAACGGGSWWNPLTWAKSVFCGIIDLGRLLGDLLAAILGLVGDLLEGLLWLIWPEDGLDANAITSEWSTKFPFSIMSEVVAAGDSLIASMTTGVNGDGCGPVVDPNLDGIIGDREYVAGADLTFEAQLPAPAEAACPGDSAEAQEAADLMGWRVPLRAMEGLLLWAFFLWRLATSIGPKARDLSARPGVS